MGRPPRRSCPSLPARVCAGSDGGVADATCRPARPFPAGSRKRADPQRILSLRVHHARGAGKNGARPGLIMPGTVLLGSRYYQERAGASPRSGAGTARSPSRWESRCRRRPGRSRTASRSWRQPRSGSGWSWTTPRKLGGLSDRGARRLSARKADTWRGAGRRPKVAGRRPPATRSGAHTETPAPLVASGSPAGLPWRCARALRGRGRRWRGALGLLDRAARPRPLGSS
jgi:hypothetical protein